MPSSDTQFKKGNAGKPKGAVNKSTKQIREALQQIYSANMESLQTDLEKMSPFNRQQILDKLASKFLPSLTKNDNTNSIEGGVTIKVEYSDSNGKEDPKLQDSSKDDGVGEGFKDGIDDYDF